MPARHRPVSPRVIALVMLGRTIDGTEDEIAPACCSLGPTSGLRARMPSSSCAISSASVRDALTLLPRMEPCLTMLKSCFHEQQQSRTSFGCQTKDQHYAYITLMLQNPLVLSSLSTMDSTPVQLPCREAPKDYVIPESSPARVGKNTARPDYKLVASSGSIFLYLYSTQLVETAI